MSEQEKTSETKIKKKWLSPTALIVIGIVLLGLGYNASKAESTGVVAYLLKSLLPIAGLVFIAIGIVRSRKHKEDNQ